MTYEVIERLLAELAGWFPDTHLHMGGDEVNLRCYNETSHIAEYLQARHMEASDLVRNHLQRVQSILQQHNKTSMVWEEAVLEYKTPLDTGTLVQVWKGAKNVADVIARGYRVVASPADKWYLDCGHGEWINSKQGANSW